MHFILFVIIIAIIITRRNLRKAFQPSPSATSLPGPPAGSHCQPVRQALFATPQRLSAVHQPALTVCEVINPRLRPHFVAP
jgi:hypothetical protein